jgi:RNA polymerase-binding protein DksA
MQARRTNEGTLMNADQIRATLLEERERLSGIRRSLEEAAAEAGAELSTIDQHPADGGSDTFERAKELAILERTESQLADVERALDRLEAGTYGTCEACGEPIGAARLRARPAARLCLPDQELAEEEGAAARSSS